MDMHEVERQREITMVSKGVDRYYRHHDKLEGQGKTWDAAPHSTVLDEMVAAMVPGVKRVQAEARKRFMGTLSGGGRPTLWDLDVIALDPAVLAYITARTLLTRSGASRHVVANQIGSTVGLEVQFDRMREQESERAKAEGRRNRIESLRRTVKEIGPRTIRKWMRKLDDLETTVWDYETRITVGMVLFAVARECLGDYVNIEQASLVSGPGAPRRTVVTAHLNEATTARLSTRQEQMANAAPWMVPMVCRPRDWEEEDRGDGTYAYAGGYLEIRKPLLKTDAIEQDQGGQWVPQEARDAVNRVQSTPWRVNLPVLDVALSAYDLGLAAVLPVAPPIALPPPIDDDEWTAMSQEERGKRKNERRAVHDHNNRLEAKRESTRRCLAVATEFSEFERIYFPHNMDFRGRLYPLPQDLHPQSDDFGRSLLEFGEGKPLGLYGLQWVAHVVAASFGEDKLSLQEQLDWCLKHADELRAVALDPLGEGYDFWRIAEEPWQFLAACLDLEGALSSPDPQHYVSHLPCHVDGTCNGLQHLSAMGRDPVGAYATNLTADPERQDVYQIVADKVIATIDWDHDVDDPTPREAARNWTGQVTRKVVKRGVMTTPYGVTPEGIRAQLINDRLCDDLEGDRLKNASYMRDCMIEAIDDTIIMGRAIMAWMQLVASELAAQGKPVEWTSPVGLTCRQEYRLPITKQLSTLMGHVRILVPNRNGELRKAKQRNSIAPNIVHSYDAAHLMKTVNACADAGVGCFAVVHDSFGTHACDVDALGFHLRDQFVEIYQAADWLAVMAESFGIQLGIPWFDGECQDPAREWAVPPARGDFDIEEVRKSRYFFF